MTFSIRKQSLVFSFLIIAIFFPTKYIHLYYVLLPAFLLALFFIYRIKFTKGEVVFWSAIIISILSLFVIRYFFIGINYLGPRDIYEYGRLFFLILLFIFFRKTSFDFNLVFLILKVYLFFDVVVSFFQFFWPGNVAVKAITNIYASPNQIDGALSISRRALGLSGDPSAHGIMLLFIVIVLSIKLFWFDKKNHKLEILMILSGFFAILMSQSQTAFVGLLLFILFLVFSFFYYHRYLVSKLRALLFSSMVFALSIYVLYSFIDKFRYLTTLFTLGLNRSSYLAREDKASHIVSLVTDHPLALISGFGKEFFGIYSTSMDNEHLYVLSVWGLLFYIVFVLIFINAVMLYIKRKGKASLYFTMSFMIGLPLAWPSAYYLVPKISLLLVLFYSYYHHSKIKQMGYM